MGFLSIIRFSRLKQAAISIFGILALFGFARWWFSTQHIPYNFNGDMHAIDIIMFVLVSYVIWHPLFMEALNWIIALHIKETKKHEPVHGVKVAFITTIVPSSEPVALLHKTFPAMVAVDYPHDTWVLDEGNSPEVQAICRQYGVKHFSRYRRRLYNGNTGKFVKKTKGGNHNSWYHQHGNEYDIVAQVDTDFIPKKHFLTETLGYFRDPSVAFVGTPQVYGNIMHSYIARGAEEQQYSFYGIVLRGLSGMGMTLLIGANHVIRVSALKDVGHYSAHITEDLLTGMKLHAKGWKSVYVPEALAIGEGPTTWKAYFNQQMRWAYGCMDILFRHSFKFYKSMGLRRTAYYFFLQQHYFSGIAMGLSVLLLSLYFIAGIRAAAVDSLTFFVYYFSILLMCWLMSVWMQRYHIHRNADPDLLLAGKVISSAAWPIWFLAFISAITGKRMSYKITPKGSNHVDKEQVLATFPLHTVFGIVSAVCLVYSYLYHRNDPVMTVWATLTAVVMLLLPYVQTIVSFIVTIERRVQRSVTTFFSQSYEVALTLPSVKSTVQDIFFLCFAVISSAVLYISRLGFYSDDWSFLGNFEVASDRSLWGLITTATTLNTFMRPMQNILDAVLFYFFGTAPLGYHVVNTSVFLLMIVLLYAILRHLNLPRFFAVAIPLVYALLPNYATDRFWYAAFQVNLSMMFYLMSLYTGLRGLSFKTEHGNIWKAVSLFCLLLSGLSYETQLPLVLLNVFLFVIPQSLYAPEATKKIYTKKNPAVFVLLTAIVLAYILLFKVFTTIRLGSVSFPQDMAQIIISAFQVHFGFFGISQLNIILEIIRMNMSPALSVMAGLVFFGIFLYLYGLLSRPYATFPNARWMRSIIGMSFIIFLLGYAVFFTNNNIGFSPTGLDNRVNIAAALGVAITLVGMIGFIAKTLLPKKIANIVTSASVAIICTSGFIIINTLAVFWSNAYQQGKAVVTAFQQHFPYLPAKSTVIFDQVCPYNGPGVVFEAHWDVKGVLQTVYRDSSIRGDIVTSRLDVRKEGIKTHIYNLNETYTYNNLIFYNYEENKAYAISSKKDADLYFSQHPRLQCAPGQPGHGQDVFTLGR